MRLPQCRKLPRRIIVITERLLCRRQQARQIDVSDGGRAAGEALAGVRSLRGRQDLTEGAIEGDPVAVGKHEMSLARSPLHCKA